MINCTNLSDFVLFADDTNIFVIAKNEHEVYKIANKVLDAVYNYFLANKLHIKILIVTKYFTSTLIQHMIIIHLVIIIVSNYVIRKLKKLNKQNF